MAAKTVGKLIFGDADTYIKSINPTANRVVESMPLRFGDMEGMMPRSAKMVGEKNGVRYFQDGDDFYAMAINPNTNEMDVIGYHLGKDGSSDLQVVEEMQGSGIGSELSYLFRRNNPEAPTGGLTESGERTARKTFQRLKDEGVVSSAAPVGIAGVLGALGLPENATAADIAFADRPELSGQGQQDAQQMVLDTLMGFFAPTRLAGREAQMMPMSQQMRGQ